MVPSRRAIIVGWSPLVLGLLSCSSGDGGVPLDAGGVPVVHAGGPRSLSPIDPDAAARAAVTLASCLTEMPAERDLLQMYGRRYPAGTPDDWGAVVPCLDQARNGCRAVADCLATTSGPNHTTTHCDGNVADTSFLSFDVRVDCTRIGRTCEIVGALAECIDTSTATCIGDAGAGAVGRCDGEGRPVSCRAGHEVLGVACPTLGLECRGGDATYCAGTEGDCPARALSSSFVDLTGVSCLGDSLRACVGGGLATVDCGSWVLGTTCQPGAGTPYCGFRSECVPGEAAAADCDGDSVVVCNGGRIDRIDCRALGFRGCASGRVSVLGDRYAACWE